jgi:hypothetical protein
MGKLNSAKGAVPPAPEKAPKPAPKKPAKKAKE